MKKYTYKVIAKPSAVVVAGAKGLDCWAHEIECELNQLGGDGWEFIQWKNGAMILKKLISEA